MDGLYLGLANGIQCLSYCAPVLVIYLLGEGKRPLKNMLRLLAFLSGRLSGYLLFGILAYCTKLILSGERQSMIIFGSSYAVVSIMMIIYAFRGTHAPCPMNAINRIIPPAALKSPLLFPVALGFLTGINLCPPFLLALTEIADSGTISQSLIFFLLFFAGTSVYFIPLSFLGFLRSVDGVKTVAKMASIGIALFYFHKGVFMIVNGAGLH
ncbi:MAG: sulfite exporter TauE/SafE family protein [Eubacteriales bacterium]|nr:sulfite exporter TauE/SafE family protein [Eubacteriales bacterium]